MQQSFKDMAHRMNVAHDDFISTPIDTAGITNDEAEKVLAVYRKAKVLKNEYAVSRITVKHGALLDRDVILRALAS
jgi:hypothetical protein